MTFDLRERDTLWTDENKARLVKLVASNQLKLSQEELELRLHELVSLVPDLGSKVHMLKPDLLAALLQDLDKAAHQMIRLKETFPDSNISLMVSKRPIMLLQDCDTIVIDARKVCALLRVENLDSLVDKHPGLLDIEAVEEVLDELRRMMPSGTDVRKMLANDPTLLLSAGRGTKRLGDHPD
ncbi:unnamed protein product [Ostreobium quekettii]|uniref:Uncharacterized protein n=1 Tax=Ostreobium quekettii TaxID=121088 RepID=A0A8S1IKL2_9CHLO|nr:unnamed protein product [Ostreobium quekettii]|eukprot:evm.model.scf_7.5 EVM.evm.TU.scf_7.5   scf_7:31102-33819(+)